jgi:hypothetical protein
MVAPPGSVNMFSRVTSGGNSEWDGPGTIFYRDDAQTISIVFRYDVFRNVHKCVASGTATRAGP